MGLKHEPFNLYHFFVLAGHAEASLLLVIGEKYLCVYAIVPVNI
jgi:hypothetical protein